MKSGILPVVLALAVVILMASQSFFVVQPGRVAVVTRAGRPTGRVWEAGPGFKLPFVQGLVILDTRLVFTTVPGPHSAASGREGRAASDWEGLAASARERPAAPSEEGRKGRAASDRQGLAASASLAWRIDDPLVFAAALQARDDIPQALSSVAAELIQKSVTQYDEKPGAMRAIENILLAEINEKIKNRGIVVENFSLALPGPANAVEILSEMRGKWQSEALKALSQGRDEAAGLKTGAEEQKTALLAGALQEGLAVKGKGEAQAVRVLGQALAATPKEFQRLFAFWELRRLRLHAPATAFSPEDPGFAGFP